VSVAKLNVVKWIMKSCQVTGKFQLKW